MGTHAGERGGLAIAAARKDMGTWEMVGSSGMVHTSDISKRDEDLRSQDFYLEVLPPEAVSAKVGPMRPSGMVGEDGRDPEDGDGVISRGDITPEKRAGLPIPREQGGSKS